MAVADIPEDPSPSVQPLEIKGSLEDRVSLGGDAVAEEPPDLCIQAVHERRAHNSAWHRGDLMQSGLRDFFALELLGPSQEAPGSGALGHKVVAHLALPSCTSFLPVEAKAGLIG